MLSTARQRVMRSVISSVKNNFEESSKRTKLILHFLWIESVQYREGRDILMPTRKFYSFSP